MKTSSTFCAAIFFTWIFTLSFFGAPPPPASNDDPEFVEARELFWSGQYNESEKKFRIYLLVHPKHEPSKSFLQMIAQERKYDPKKIVFTRKRLESVMIKEMNLKDAEWRAVSAFFQEQANPKENGKDPKDYINFINMLPTDTSFKVSVNLRNVTLMRAIELTCRQAGLRYVLDTWAVIIDLPESKK